jgi:hypothetical protein
VVPWIPPKELCASAKEEASRSLEEHGIKIDDGVFTHICCVWLDIKPYIFFLVPKGGTSI